MRLKCHLLLLLLLHLATEKFITHFFQSKFIHIYGEKKDNEIICAFIKTCSIHIGLMKRDVTLMKSHVKNMFF